ncbi:Mss4-like protein [Paraphoma chrysanthemicola]|nr:Mss4-like protein [Paraphoma chrysanthemicola]
MATKLPSVFNPLKGHCTCKSITYTLAVAPLITHGCHCTYCQRESGSAFAINAIVEASNFSITSTLHPNLVGIPSLSSVTGDAHLVARCPKCLTAVYAHYAFMEATADKNIICLRVGTLDEESKRRVRPDVHIFTSTKMEWVDLESERARGIKIVDEYYDRNEVWSKESLDRWAMLLQKTQEQKGCAGME